MPGFLQEIYVPMRISPHAVERVIQRSGVVDLPVSQADMQATLTYYSKNAEAIAARYESVTSSLSNSFKDAFSPQSKLLDIGCGSGRDLALLASLGHDCFGVDATPEFVALSQSLHSQLQGKVLQATLPNFSPPFGGEFDSVLCSAVLMRVAEKELPQSAVSIKRCLKKSGRLRMASKVLKFRFFIVIKYKVNLICTDFEEVFNRT